MNDWAIGLDSSLAFFVAPGMIGGQLELNGACMRWSHVFLFTAILLPLNAFAGFRVSSERKLSGKMNLHGAASAIDGDLKTCWQVDPESEQKGEWIEIDLPASEVDKISVVIGWAKSEVAYKDYARIKAARVEVYSGEDDGEKRLLEHTLQFEDKMEMQTIDLPDTKIGGEMFGGRVRLIITEIYPGQDYPNVAVSEVLVHLKEMDASAAFVSPPAAIEKHDSMAMLDDNTRTYWASPPKGEGSEFSISASGFGVSSIGLLPGPKTMARPKKIEVTVSDNTQTFDVENKPTMQYFPLPAIVGYTGSAWGDVAVKILETYPGSSSDNVAISEVKLRATNYDGL